MARRLPLLDAAKPVEAARRSVEPDWDAAFPLGSLGGLSARARAAGATFWSQRAWSEFAAIPVLSQVLLAQVREAAPFGESAGVASVLRDEAIHTELSKRVADALGGYEDVVPDYFAIEPTATASITDLSLGHWLVAGAAVGETVSRALIHARLRHAREPALRRVVLRTLKDENRHVAFSWAALRRVLPKASAAERRDFAAFAQPTVAAAFRFQGLRHLPAAARATERRLRQRVSEAGLGACPPDEEDAVVERALREQILPGLRRLGVRL